MLLHVRQVLKTAELHEARKILSKASWTDGRVTSGEQSAKVKNNQQLPEAAEETQLLQQLVLRGLEQSPLFFSGALPKQISPPMFNRYSGETSYFGDHVDSAVRYFNRGAGRVRTDISCTLFLSDPADYDGGELVIEDTLGSQRVKLDAGDLIVYPGTTVHRVEPVTRGERIASFFWVQSMIRSDEQRRLLFDMDKHLRQLRSTHGETDSAAIGLTSTYHNLLRMWADT